MNQDFKANNSHHSLNVKIEFVYSVARNGNFVNLVFAVCAHICKVLQVLLSQLNYILVEEVELIVDIQLDRLVVC